MKKLEKLVSSLNPHLDIIDGDQLDDLQALLGRLRAGLAAHQEEGRNLRIAVIGQMNAGKSSFLNAALFGRDLLPKAETPMTAALTKIVYAPKERAEVVFYTKEDWDDIEQHAREYALRYAAEEARLIEESTSSPFAKARQPSKSEVDRKISELLRASAELVQKARGHALNVDAYLGQIKVLDQIDGSSLAQSLHEYVGSGGRFTAITKSTVLYVNDDQLKGLEIIDTPGFNDPVVSRGKVTRQHLSQCDVILILSNLSQFITTSDMSVMREQLSEAGIDEKAIFLIGTHRDISFRQDPEIAKIAEKLAVPYPLEQRAAVKLKAMLRLLGKKMEDHARKTLDAQICQPGLDEKTKRILGALNQTAPRFISAWSWLVAEKFLDLSADDQEQLQKLSHDTGYDFDDASLRALSNIPAVWAEVLTQRERKDQLIAGKEKNLRDDVWNSAGKRLHQMRQSLTERSDRILNGNISALEKAEQETVKRLNAGRVRLESVFDEQLASASQQFALLKTDIRGKALKYSRVESLTKTESTPYEVSTSSWYKPWTWGDKEIHYDDVVTVYASAQDAIERVEDFALQSTKALQKSIMECVNLDALQRNVGRAAMALFDTESADFDGELMLAEVNKSLRKITIPEVAFGSKDYSRSIAKSFGRKHVSESKIDGLQDAQRAAVASVIADLEAEVSLKVKEITHSLEAASKSFVSNMSCDIQASLSKLRDDIANKEKSIQQINQALKTVDTCLSSM